MIIIINLPPLFQMRSNTSFSNFINTNPDVIIGLLDQLKQRDIVKASEYLVPLLNHCTKCEPDWESDETVTEQQPVFYPPPSNTDLFWMSYQALVKNVETYCISRLMHHLRKLHGPLLYQIEYSIKHSSSKKMPKQSFINHFQVYHDSVQNLLKALIYRVPLLRYNILVESSLFTTSPVQYKVEFVAPEDWLTFPYHLRPNYYSSQTPIAFCFTSYLKFPFQLTVPPFYFSNRDPGGFVRFIPHDNCAQCSSTSVPSPGLNHLIIIEDS